MTAAVADDLISVDHARAARIADLSPARLTYWTRQGIAQPIVVGRVRLYDFPDLLSVLVASELRQRNVTLHTILKIVAHLRQRGYNHPLSELRFATQGKSVYFQHHDGTWEGNVLPDQIVFHEVLSLDPLRRRIREGIKRSPDTYGKIERRRGVQGGQPVFAGTRIPVARVRRYLDQGWATDEVVKVIPGLVHEDVAAAASA